MFWFMIESFGALFRWATNSMHSGRNLGVCLCSFSRSVWQLCHTGWFYLLSEMFSVIVLSSLEWILETDDCLNACVLLLHDSCCDWYFFVIPHPNISELSDPICFSVSILCLGRDSRRDFLCSFFKSSAFLFTGNLQFVALHDASF